MLGRDHGKEQCISVYCMFIAEISICVTLGTSRSYFGWCRWFYDRATSFKCCCYQKKITAFKNVCDVYKRVYEI